MNQLRLLALVLAPLVLSGCGFVDLGAARETPPLVVDAGSAADGSASVPSLRMTSISGQRAQLLDPGTPALDAGVLGPIDAGSSVAADAGLPADVDADVGDLGLVEHPIAGCVPSPCVNGGACVPTLGGSVCVCPPGFTGVYCETAILM